MPNPLDETRKPWNGGYFGPMQREAESPPHPRRQPQRSRQQAPPRRKGLKTVSREAIGEARRALDEGRQTVMGVVGEGPKPLRGLCFAGGILLVVAGVLGCVDVSVFLMNPTRYVMHLYLVGFGLMIMAIEAKDVQWLDAWRTVIHEWIKALTIPAGKGLFYILCSSLACSLWQSNWVAFIGGIYIGIMGLICILVHFGYRNAVQHAGIDVTRTQYPEQRASSKRRTPQQHQQHQSFLRPIDEEAPFEPFISPSQQGHHHHHHHHEPANSMHASRAAWQLNTRLNDPLDWGRMTAAAARGRQP